MKWVKFEYFFLSHWGSIHILPELCLGVNFNIPTIRLVWWVFRFDITIYKRLPDWFMRYVWNTLMLDFKHYKEKDEE